MGQGSQTPTPAEGADNRTRTLRGPLAFSRAGEIAQLVEHTTENRGVPGSSPGLAIGESTANPSLTRGVWRAPDRSKRGRRPFPAFSAPVAQSEELLAADLARGEEGYGR